MQISSRDRLYWHHHWCSLSADTPDAWFAVAWCGSWFKDVSH